MPYNILTDSEKAYAMVFDYRMKNVVLQETGEVVHSLIELDGKHDTDLIFGMDSNIGTRSVQFVNGSEDKLPYLKTKRFVPEDLDRVRLYYVALRVTTGEVIELE